jgi:murein DD-endopeptidase MepM/ murein hydrolase activator NlpD
MSSIEYRVRSGDTLSAIAQRYKVTVSALAQANNVRDIHRIRVGQVLKIPSESASVTQPPLKSSTPEITIRLNPRETTAPRFSKLKVKISLYKKEGPPWAKKEVPPFWTAPELFTILGQFEGCANAEGVVTIKPGLRGTGATDFCIHRIWDDTRPHHYLLQ